MFRKTVLTISSFLLILASQAQQSEQTHTTEQRALQTVNHLSEKVSLLTQSKKDTLVLIFKDYFDDIKIYRAQQNEKMIKAIEQTRDERVQNLLANPTQYAEYQKYMAEMKAQRQQQQQSGGGQHHHGGHHGGGGGGGNNF
jgi:hypothetical protein